MMILVMMLLAVAVMLACATYHPPHPLYYTDWSLVAWNGHVAEGAEIAFLDGSRFNGSTGCNSFEGRYGADHESFTVSDMTKQEAGCPTPALFAQERAMVEILVSSLRYQMDEYRLTIEGEGGRFLVFEK